MEREHVLSVLYDLTLTIGGETRLDNLLRRVLQRLLYHTSFPVGLAFTEGCTRNGRYQGLLSNVVGDHLLERQCGECFTLSERLSGGAIELLERESLPATIEGKDKYPFCLKLPIDEGNRILLLSSGRPSTELPLTQIFKPVLSNLSRSILLCRNSERMTRSLESDRDQARLALTRALEQSERERVLLRSLNDTIPDLIWLKDSEGCYLACNKAFAALYGTSEEALIGKSDYDFLDPHTADTIREKDLSALHTVDPVIVEEPMQSVSKGRYGVFETIRTPLKTEAGKLIGVLGISRDISKRKQAEEAQRVSERRFELAMQAANDGLWDWDLQTDEIYFSPRWKSMLGYEDHELPNSLNTWERLTESVDREQTLSLVEDCIEGRSTGFVSEYRMRHKAGHWVDILSRAIMINDEKGDPLRMVGTHVDLSERKAAERALLEKEKAEAMAQAKSAFLANMSHEIRTPLHGVLGLAKMGEREESAEQSRELFTKIGVAGRHLLQVVNDILDFSKIEAGKLAVVNQPFELAASLHNALSLIHNQARQRGLAISLELDDGLPQWVQGDQLRLEQILVNLLSNAVKFTDQGSIELLVSAKHDRLHFTVSDSGVGMSEAQMSRLFLPFEQADSSTTRRFGGSGLGLAISINLAKIMGGTISVSSHPGEGSAFTLALPLVVAQPVMDGSATGLPDIPANGRQLEGLRILAAEDVDINRLILEDLLENEKAEVIFADNGQTALDLLQVNGATSFDLVLMDVQMPVLDGFEASRRIRTIAPGLPIIGLTAHAMQEEREKCFSAGMVDHITKPLDPDILIASIRKHTAKLNPP